MREKFRDLPLRSGVGIIVLNKENKVFVAKRIDNPKNFWQMPQGGVDEGEDFLTAAYRELEEETSIKKVEMIKEIDELAQMDIAVKDHLHISDRAQLVMPWHKTFDLLGEEQKGLKKIGTTGRGIGPAYEDKVRRSGMRVGDLLEPELFKARLEGIVEEKNKINTNFQEKPHML